MHAAEDLLTQTGRATLALAQILLKLAPGDRLPRMVDLARGVRAGNGTVQDALAYLTRSGAIAVETHGAQGSTLAAISYSALWRYAGNQWIVGSMPLPYTLRYEGLATALYAALETSGLSFNMTYQRGSVQRGEMVRNGHYHFAVMSLLAAQHLQDEHPELAIVAEFPAQTYVTEHALITRVSRDKIRRVGVDFSSLDELLLTDAEFQGVPALERVPIEQTQVTGLLQNGSFDAVVWNRDGLQVSHPDIAVLPLQVDPAKSAAATRAAIVTLHEAPVKRLLLSIFSREDVAAIQSAVLRHERMPRY